jgi:hypothetical protein
MSAQAILRFPGDPYAENRAHLKHTQYGTRYERFVVRSYSGSHGIRMGKFSLCPPQPKVDWEVYRASAEPRSVSLDLSPGELEERRWSLTRRSWDNKLTPRELLELRWVEAKLNAAEQKRASRVIKQRRDLAGKKTRLLASIERLVAEVRES